MKRPTSRITPRLTPRIAPATEPSIRGVFTRRALLVMGGQVVVFGLLGRTLYRVQVEEGGRYATMADSNRISTRLTAPPRGHIVDRFGVVLAGNRLNWRALLNIEQADAVGAVLDRMQGIVGLGEGERSRIERDLRRERKYVPILVKEFLDWDEMARIEVNAPDLPGISIDLGMTRTYPLGERLAHVVGYVAPASEEDVDDDPTLALPGMRVGRAGMERARDDVLEGRAGAVQVEVNAAGRVVRELDRQDGAPGAELALTIDSDLQQTVLGRLGDESASAVVLDCRNGEVMAMTTTPSFDPEKFNFGVSQAQWVEWTNDKRAPLINKAAAGVYAPGSTFKMCVAMAALESGMVTAADRVTCPGFLDFADTRFHCWSKNGHGSVDMHGAIKHSCDVYFYETARRIGMDRISAMAHRLGMGVDTGIELPGARPGLVPNHSWRPGKKRRWGPADTIMSGIGQGYILVTPLALATYAARIATGRAVVPHLTRAIGGETQTGAAAEDWPRLTASAATLDVARKGMWAVVNEGGGTAPLARLPDSVNDGGKVTLAGKTGSSQVHHVSRWQRESTNFDSSKLPWELRPHALFVAYAPFEAPRYALAVVVEHGNAGAAAAAPLARDIMTDVLLRDPAAARDGRVAMAGPGR